MKFFTHFLVLNVVERIIYVPLTMNVMDQVSHLYKLWLQTFSPVSSFTGFNSLMLWPVTPLGLVGR